jgi:hypothetical protein
MKIRLEHDHHRCADGCCDTYGYWVLVNGVKIGHIENDDPHQLAQILSHHLTLMEAGEHPTLSATMAEL